MTDSLFTYSVRLLASHETPPMKLLQLADPSMELIESYLRSGQCYVLERDAQIVGVIVIVQRNQLVAEIKNIAVDESYQGKGLGRLLMQYVDKACKKSGYQKLIIGTGNSSLRQLALYQRQGFEITAVRKNFFLDNYPDPIYEDGIQCKHQIILQKEL